MEVGGANGFVMLGSKVFCVVVSKVFDAWLPVYVELALFDAVTDPVEAHVDSFGSALFHGVVDYSGCARVVYLNGGGRLGPTKFEESCADGACILCVVEASSNFSFGGGRHDVAEDAADDVNGAVERGRGGFGVVGWFGAEKKYAAGS